MDNLALKTSSETSSTFTGDCECINKIKFEYPLNYNAYDPEQYAEIESGKLDEYIAEVEKHTNPKSADVEKPCFKKDHTTCLLYVKSKKKQKRSLLAFRQILNAYPFKSKFKIPFGLHGKPSQISVEAYMNVIEQVNNYSIVSSRSFKKADSRCEIVTYLASLKSCKATLGYLKKLIEYKGE